MSHIFFSIGEMRCCIEFKCYKSIPYIMYSDLGAVETARHRPMAQTKRVVKKDRTAKIMARRISTKALDVAQMERRLLRVQKIKVVT